jgi:hypothetical protein
MPPSASLSASMNGGSLFSPSSQIGSPPPLSNNNIFSPNHNINNNMANNPSTPAAGPAYRGVYEESDIFQSPPLITPSKQGDGAARRRSPYR